MIFQLRKYKTMTEVLSDAKKWLEEDSVSFEPSSLAMSSFKLPLTSRIKIKLNIFSNNNLVPCYKAHVTGNTIVDIYICILFVL